ncbi:hypothetical protein QWZ13_19370 [Reinekea marina]|uniref:Uncharacterized protein n=1 Tax=Reinekea marina TaxID=1310421 RepID=A0ABV7WR45_9GAMM|nr:hypothetical protein [Reinekea marina]MDN3647320.1 hypothetical protein [Reinekea marina]MDN3651076.1 hypothetical protein [Reinekea marina]
MKDIGTKNLVEVKGAGRSTVVIRSQNRPLPKAGGQKRPLPTPGIVGLNKY